MSHVLLNKTQLNEANHPKLSQSDYQRAFQHKNTMIAKLQK